MFGTGLILKCTRLIHLMICVTEIPSAVVLTKTVNIARSADEEFNIKEKLLGH